MTSNALLKLAVRCLFPTLAVALAACAGSEDDGAGGADSPAAAGGGGGGGAAAADAWTPNPAWLVGSYAYGTRIENNIPFTNEDRTIELQAPAGGRATYKYKYGKDWVSGETGSWRLEGKTLVLDGGYLAGRRLDLATAMTVDCRVLDLDGTKLRRSARVEGCPFENPPLAAEERCLAGTYTKSGGDDSVSHTLDVDRFYLHATSRTTGRCYGSTCKYLTNTPHPTVGRWRLVGGVIEGTGLTLESIRGFTFKPLDPSCGGAPTSTGGADAGTSSSSSSGAPAFDAGTGSSSSSSSGAPATDAGGGGEP